MGGKNVKLYNERQVYLHPKFSFEFSPDVSVNVLGIHKAWSSPTFYTKGSAHSRLPPALFTSPCILQVIPPLH